MKDWMAQVWCKKMHRGAMWPIHGKYVCPQCLREHPVAWEGDAPARSSSRISEKAAAVAAHALSSPLVGSVHVVDSYQSPVLR
jgi:hypothetical protein